MNRALYHSHINQHGGQELQNPPWTQGPWVGKEQEFPGWREIYEGNQLTILKRRRKVGDYKTEYNFPTDDLRRGIDEF